MNDTSHDVLMLVDAVDRGGNPVRITLGVPCHAEEVGPLPLAGDFVLGDGRRATYFGYDRAPFLPAASLPMVSGMVRSNVADYLRLADIVPVPAAAVGTDRSSAKEPTLLGYARYGVSDEWLPVDRAVIDEAARRLRAVFARAVVASDGEILVRAPFPIWIGTGRSLAFTLGIHMRTGYVLDGATEFAAGRLEAACRYVGLRTPAPGGDGTEVRGRVLYIDRSFEDRDDRALAALRAGRFVSDKLRHALPGMPGPMVAGWHLAAYGARADAAKEPWDVEATLRSVAALIAYGEDRANGCNGSADSAVWKAHRRRILDIELSEGTSPELTESNRAAPLS
jgi:hypothetical protein